MIDKRGILFKDRFKFNDFVDIIQPTVYKMTMVENYSSYNQIICISIRELFSFNPRQVDFIEEEFPTMWEAMFNTEMNDAIGQMFGAESARDLFIQAVAFWTETNAEDFECLENSKKFMHSELGWIITKQEFEKFQEYVRFLTGYEPNDDLIAPKGISSANERILDLEEKTYEGRLKEMKKKSSSIEEKIIILQVSNGGYISLDEIKNMSLYHFNKLFEALNEKEAYRVQWDVYRSSKFMPKTGSKQNAPKHWKEKFKA